MHRHQIIKAIETYSDLSGLKASTICQYAVRNRHLYDNLVSGGNYTALTAERLIQWIKDNPATLRKRAS